MVAIYGPTQKAFTSLTTCALCLMAAHPLSYNWEVKNSVSTWLMLSELTVSLEVARQATWEIPVVKWAKFE